MKKCANSERSDVIATSEMLLKHKGFHELVIQNISESRGHLSTSLVKLVRGLMSRALAEPLELFEHGSRGGRVAAEEVVLHSVLARGLLH